MRLIDAQQKLLALNVPIIETDSAAACLKISITHASQILNRLVKSGLFWKVAKGKWAVTKKMDPFILPDFLTAPFPSYISLQSALYHHGMISQIPATIYSVSIARTRKYTTEMGSISIHHINPSLFFGFEYIQKTQIKIASPEKALWDFLYLFTAKSHLFKTLPELELPKKFNINQMIQWVEKIESKSRASAMQKKLVELGESLDF